MTTRTNGAMEDNHSSGAMEDNHTSGAMEDNQVTQVFAAMVARVTNGPEHGCFRPRSFSLHLSPSTPSQLPGLSSPELTLSLLPKQIAGTTQDVPCALSSQAVHSLCRSLLAYGHSARSASK